MGADLTLVQGAYKAASAGASAISNINNVQKEVSKQLVSFANKTGQENKEYQKYVQSVLNSAGDLPADEYNALYEKLQEGKNAYIYGGNKDKSLAIRELNMKKADYTEYKDFRLELSQAIDNDLLRNGWDQTPEGKALLLTLEDSARLVEYKCAEGEVKCPNQGRMGILMPDPEAESNIRAAKTAINTLDTQIQTLYDRADYDENGEPVFIPGDENKLAELLKEYGEHEETIRRGDQKWVSVDDLKKSVGYKDDVTKGVIESMGNNYIQMSAMMAAGDLGGFNKDAAEHLVKTNIIDKGDVLSLAYDEHISGRTFADDLANSIAGKSWGDLGVTDDDLKLYVKENPVEGVDVEDGISEEEKELIREQYEEAEEKLSDREEQVNEYLSVYSVYNSAGQLVDSDGIIDDEEAVLIAKAMIENPDYSDIFRDELTDYYVQFMENQWGIGVKSRKQSKEKKEEENNQKYNL